MGGFVRKTVYLSADQAAKLASLAGETGVSESEVVRQAIDHYTPQLLTPERRREVWKKEREFIQRLIEQGPIEGGGRTWRREDAYDI